MRTTLANRSSRVMFSLFHQSLIIANMLCLCPNHHAQFDDRVFYIDPDNLKIIGLSAYEGKKLITSKKHKIDPQFLQHQKHLCLEEES